MIYPTIHYEICYNREYLITIFKHMTMAGLKMYTVVTKIQLSLPPNANFLKAMEEELMEEKSTKVMIACEQNLSKNRQVLSDENE